jgi:K+-transporting ATPase ATPase B chain
MTTTLTTPTGSDSPSQKQGRKQASAFSAGQLVKSIPDALRKLDPRLMWRNPVMFVVEIGAALTTLLAIATPFLGASAQTTSSPTSPAFIWSIAVWLWLTTLFANMAEAVAEGRGKAQAKSLRDSRTSTMAERVRAYDETGDPGAERAEFEKIASAELTLGDTVVVVAGEPIPGDGDIIWGIASVDESAITGESAPVVRESGGVRPHRRAHHVEAGRDLRRPHDQAGRGRLAAEDSQ